MVFKDRLLRGALAGVIGSLFLLTWNLFSYYILHFARQTWLETLNQLVMGHSIKGTMEFITTICLLFIWNGFLGAIFVRFVIPERDGSYIGRAIVYGLATWFLLFSIGTLYKIEGLHQIHWQTAISNWISIIFYGVILGWLTKRWDKSET